MRSIIEVDKNKMKFYEFSSLRVVRVTRAVSQEKESVDFVLIKMLFRSLRHVQVSINHVVNFFHLSIFSFTIH